MTLTATDVTGGSAVLTLPVAVVAATLVVRPGSLEVTTPPPGPLRDSLTRAITPLVFGVEDVSGSLCQLALAGDDDRDDRPDPGRLCHLPAGVRSGAHCTITAARWGLPVAISTAGDALPGRQLALETDLGFTAASPTVPSSLTGGRLRLSLRRADLAALLGHEAGLEPAAADAAVAAAYPGNSSPNPSDDWLPIELGFTAIVAPAR